jgi:hypothetical protein
MNIKGFLVINVDAEFGILVIPTSIGHLCGMALHRRQKKQ